MQTFLQTIYSSFIRSRAIFLLVAVVVVAIMAASAFSLEAPSDVYKKDIPVELEADSLTYDKKNQTYTAEGNVVAVQEGTTVKADSMVLDNANAYLTAEGNLLVTDEAGNEISGRRFELNIDKKTALLLDGKVFFKEGNVYVASPEMEKTGEQSYKAKKVSFTTCDCDEGEKPDWNVTLGASKVTLGEYFTGRNAFFRVKGMPVLYSPYVVFPVNRERQTGFLAPGFGQSRRSGIRVNNSFFWAATDSMDATFYLDVETKRGTGGGLEYRFYRNPKSYSELELYYFREKDIDRIRDLRDATLNNSRPLTADNDRYELKFFHDETLLPGLKLKADLHIVSDDEYFLDFSEESEMRTLNAIDNTVSLTWNKSYYSLITEFRWFDDLLDGDDDDVLHKLPEIRLNASPQRISHTPFYVSFESSFVNFVRSVGQEGMRVDLSPRLSLPLSPLDLFEITPSIAPRYTAYSLEDGPGDRYPDRFIYEFKTDLVTTFIKDYQSAGKRVEKLRHIVRPRLTYRFRPDKEQSELPEFDLIDNVTAANEVEYSLASSLAGRLVDDEGETFRHEYFYLKFSQTFDIKEERRTLVGPDDKHRPLSVVDGELIIRPMPGLMFDSKTEYDVYHTRFDYLSIVVAASDKRGDKIKLSYNYNRETLTRYAEGSARIKVAKPIFLIFKERYRLEDDRNLETVFGVEFKRQCWGVTVTYRDRPEDQSVFVTLNLLSLGDVLGYKYDQD